MTAQELKDPLPAGLYTKYSHSLFKRTEKLNQQFDKKSEKALQRHHAYERAVYNKLSKIDSIAAKNFLIVSAQRQKELDKVQVVKGPFKRYVPFLDTVSTSLHFLSQSSVSKANITSISKALGEINGLTDRLKNGDDLKDYLRDQTSYISEHLKKFGLLKEFKRMDKNLYYFSAEVSNIKESIGDANKIERKVVSVLRQIKPFQQFIRKHGMLSSILPDADDPVNIGQGTLAGLQSRSSMDQLIQQQIAAGGPGAANAIQSNIQLGQQQLQQIKDRLIALGNKGSEDIMPQSFAPDHQHGKSFFKRLELTPNLQFRKGSAYLPIASDFGLALGYRLSGRATVGIGASYRMGWGERIQQVHITHQGVGVRSYFDWKIPSGLLGIKNTKGTWWLTGGYEQNYNAEIKKIEELKDKSAWQKSGLIGISKSVSFKSRLLKGTKFQLLWDFLSHRQTPAARPIIFRVGYSIQ